MIMPDITIRSASSEDAASLAELAAQTFPLACPPHTTAEAIAAFIAEHFTIARFDGYLGDTDRTLLVAEEADGRFVGYSMLIAGEPADADAAAAVGRRPTIELSKFYTRAAAHGTGVAQPLMAATLDAASTTGARSAWLGVNEENARAIRFYEKHGFAKVGRKHFNVGGRFEDDWVLERPLQ
jgi:ribosomal protein S18 acetylase RimI-like enzyme